MSSSKADSGATLFTGAGAPEPLGIRKPSLRPARKLVMDKDLAHGFPERKTRVIKDFFGGTGRVVNPYKNNGEFSEEYRNCLRELRQIIEPNVDKLISSLQTGAF